MNRPCLFTVKIILVGSCTLTTTSWRLTQERKPLRLMVQKLWITFVFPSSLSLDNKFRNIYKFMFIYIYYSAKFLLYIWFDLIYLFQTLKKYLVWKKNRQNRDKTINDIQTHYKKHKWVFHVWKQVGRINMLV